MSEKDRVPGEADLDGHDHEGKEGAATGVDRRSFLRSAAKAGVIAPPAMTMLLSTTLSSPALAHSGDHYRHHDKKKGDNFFSPRRRRRTHR